jgi:hypothetical protein
MHVRGAPFLFFLSLGVSLASASSAADPIQACIDAHATGQIDEQEGRLRSAHRLYLTCSQANCPPIVQKECAVLLDKLGETIPRFLVRAVEDGAETTRVRVVVDGEVVESSISGRPILVDPGERAVTVDFGSRGVSERRVVFRQGEKVEMLAFDAPPQNPRGAAPPATPPGRGFPVLGGVFAGVAALGAGSFAFFGLRGLGLESDLEKHCGPPCTKDDLAPLRRDYLIADISLAIGVVSAGLATWFFLHGGPATPAARAAETR